jgi:hypothetical protein
MGLEQCASRCSARTAHSGPCPPGCPRRPPGLGERKKIAGPLGRHLAPFPGGGMRATCVLIREDDLIGLRWRSGHRPLGPTRQPHRSPLQRLLFRAYDANNEQFVILKGEFVRSETASGLGRTALSRTRPPSRNRFPRRTTQPERCGSSSVFIKRLLTFSRLMYLQRDGATGSISAKRRLYTSTCSLRELG